MVLGGFGEVFGRAWEPFGRSGGLPRLFFSCFGTFLGCLAIFSTLWVNFWLFLLFLVTLSCCGMFLLNVACWVLFCVLLSAGLLGAMGTSQRVLGVLDRFYLVFSNLVAPRGASAASVARHQRGKSRKEERQDEEEAFLKFAWLFLLLLAIAAFYCFFFA